MKTRWKTILAIMGIFAALSPPGVRAQSALPWVFHSGATGTANGNALQADYYSTVAVQIEGTFVGTVTFEKKTKDATAYVSVQCTNASDGTKATDTAEPGYWECPGGANSFRARVSTYTSGTIVVTGNGTTAVVAGRGGGTAQGLDANFDIRKDIDGANSEPNAFVVGDGPTRCAKFWGDLTEGFVFKPCVLGNTLLRAWNGFKVIIRDVAGAADMLTFDPAAASRNLMYLFGSNYRPDAWIPCPLLPRGAATMSETNIVTNQPKDYWIQVTASDSDAVDCAFFVNKRVSNVTALKVRLEGVSKNPSPANNIQLHCAARSNRAGTDTYAAHSTTGEQAITLTPATQNRPVSVESNTITINGTVAEFAKIFLSCEVSASGTTSTQLADFFLNGTAFVKLIGLNSLSD